MTYYSVRYSIRNDILRELYYYLNKIFFHYICFIFVIKSNIKIRGGRSWRRGTKCDCNIDWLWVRSPLEEVKYLFTFIFPFFRSGVEAKRGVEFRHSTRSDSRINGKWERCVLTLGSLCLPYYVRDTA